MLSHLVSEKERALELGWEIISILQLRKGRHDEFPYLSNSDSSGGLGGKPSPTFCKGSATGPPLPPVPAGATEHLRGCWGLRHPKALLHASLESMPPLPGASNNEIFIW